MKPRRPEPDLQISSDPSRSKLFDILARLGPYYLSSQATVSEKVRLAKYASKIWRQAVL